MSNCVVHSPILSCVPLIYSGFGRPPAITGTTLENENRRILHEDQELRITEAPKKGAKKSEVWRYGDYVLVTHLSGPNKAKPAKEMWMCRICKDEGLRPVLCSAGSTGKAMDHIVKYHEKDLRSKTQKPAQEDAPIYLPDWDEMEIAIAKLVAINHLSFQVVESPEFLDVARLFNPEATNSMPESADWVRDSVKCLYTQQKSQVRELLANLPYKPSLAFDVWTSPNHHPILAVVAYWYNGVDVSCALLGLREIDGSHTGINLAHVIESIESEYGLKPGDVIAHVGDNAANNGTTLDHLGDTGRRTQVRCSGHSLNLGARELLKYLDKETDDVGDMGCISKIRELAVHISRSPQLNQLWDARFKKRIALDNKTRWNSTLTMVESVTTQTTLKGFNKFLCEVNIDTSMKEKLRELTLTEDEWEMLMTVQGLLKPFEGCTKELQGASAISHWLTARKRYEALAFGALCEPVGNGSSHTRV